MRSLVPPAQGLAVPRGTTQIKVDSEPQAGLSPLAGQWIVSAPSLSQEAETHYIEPGCPWQNAYGESFNGKFRDECLNMEVFLNPVEAQVRFEAWRRYYNTERPHSSLGYITPEEFHSAWEDRQVAEKGDLNSAPEGVATAPGEQVGATDPTSTQT